MDPALEFEEALVASCIDRPNDRGPINAFVRRYSGVVLQAIRWTLLRYGAFTRQEAEDVFQDVFVSLFADDLKRLRQYESSTASLGTYLCAVARNAAIDHLRRRRPSSTLKDDLPDGAAPLDEHFELKEQAGRVRELLKELSPRDRLFFKLYFEDLMPPEQIAEVMGIGRDTVYSKKAKLIEKLRSGTRKQTERERADTKG